MSATSPELCEVVDLEEQMAQEEQLLAVRTWRVGEIGCPHHCVPLCVVLCAKCCFIICIFMAFLSI